MPGKKRKAAVDVKEVAEYRKKLRRSAPPPLKLSNRKRKQYTIKSPFPQRFSLPSNILLYIAQNPLSPDGHLKFISTCKALLRMSRILPVKALCNDGDKWYGDVEVSIDLKNQLSKLWICDFLCIESTVFPNLASTLVNHIYQCSLRLLHVHSQVLTVEELQLLVAGDKLDTVSFYNTVVNNDDGSVTEFEKVFEILCCKKLKFTFHSEQHGIGKSTTKKLIEMLSSDRLPAELDICLYSIPQDFDFGLFSEFLKANMTGRQHSFVLEFDAEISDEYKNQLQQFIDEIIQLRGIYAHTVPKICFADQDFGSYLQLFKMRNFEVDGILQKQK